MITVTKPYLPPKEEYDQLLLQIWENQWITNHGPLNNLLQEKLGNYLGVKNILLVNNGTFALQVSLKSLDIKGQVITTPFSFIATTSSLLWEGLKPVFVDINEHTLNIDVDKIEEKITPDTSAILATHVFGNPCEIEKIDSLAKKHNLKVIYDAAQAFGSTYLDKSIYHYGDISCASFHATKIFHMTEGGAVFTKNNKYFDKISQQSNFGYTGVNHHVTVGINGKNSEFHAAMGLSVFNHISEILNRRKQQYLRYFDLLKNSGLKFQKLHESSQYNYSYFPIVLSSSHDTTRIQKLLNSHNIYPRRYFNPSLNTLSFIAPQSCPNSELIASRILCLPLYHDLNNEEIDKICHLIGKEL